MYHEIVGNKSTKKLSKYLYKKYLMSEQCFSRQLEFLSTRGIDTKTVNELHALFSNSDSKIVVLTFDDGFSGNYTHALKLLKKFNFKATFFIATDLVNRPCMLSWNQIIDMSNQGMEIGSHTSSHLLLGIESVERIRNELLKSKEIIEDKIKKEVISVSYPNGSYNDKVNSIAQESGYQHACVSDFGYWDTITQTFLIPRIIPGERLVALKKIVEQNKTYIFKENLSASAKNMLKVALGRRFYDRLYLKLFGLETLTK